MSKVAMRKIARFNALKYASHVLFNADATELLEDYEEDDDYYLLNDLLCEEIKKISSQLSKKADKMKNSSILPNMIKEIIDSSIENRLDIKRYYSDENFNQRSKGDEFTKDKNGNITEINRCTLVVKNLTAEAGKPYFQAWVNGYQNEGSTHNEAVERAFLFYLN